MQVQIPIIHQATYDAVFQHPISHNLQWREVRAMLEHFCDSAEEHNGSVKFARNGETLIVHPPRRKDFSDVAEVMRIRHFLERSADPVAPTASADAGHHVVVLIDHREAKIFHAQSHGSTPQRITALVPVESNRYLHAVGDDDNGQRKAEPKPFYDAVVRALGGANKILIFGNATGASSAMEHLVAELKLRHPAIAEHILGVETIDEKHMTDDQLLAQARTFFENDGRKA